MTTSPSQKFTSLWHAHESRATISRNFTRNFSSARARRAVFESRVLTLFFFPTDEGLSTSRNVLKEHQKTSQFQTIILQLLAYIRLLNVTFYDAFLDHDKINVDNIFQLKIALDCFFFCIVELFVCCHLFCACACVKYLI